MPEIGSDFSKKPDRAVRVPWSGKTRVLMLLIIGAIIGYTFGTLSARRDVQARDAQIRELSENAHQLQEEITSKSARLKLVEGQLNAAHATMTAMVPTENTYNVEPNHSILAANGLLTIGMVGSPTGDTVNINVNGKHVSATAGDVIKVSPNDTSNCEVLIQSFDMFKAVVTAICSAAKPK